MPAPTQEQPQAPPNPVGRPDQAAVDAAFDEIVRNETGAEFNNIIDQNYGSDETPATPPAETQEPLTIALIDTSAARREQARDAADARLAAETHVAIDPNNITSENKIVRGLQTAKETLRASGGFRGFIRQRVWKGNVANEYYRQKYTREAMHRIDETNNLYAGERDAHSREAMGAVVNRFTHEFATEMLHSGEKRHEVEEGRDNAMRTAITNLIGAYARDELNEGSFEEEKNRVLKELAKNNPAAFGEGLLFADNLLEIAQNVKARIRHDRGVEDILASAKFVVGEARMGVRSEAHFNRVDKVIDKLHKSKIGSLVNESTIAAAAAITVAVARRGQAVATSKAVALATGGALGVVAGVMGYSRESKRLKEERTQHMRERAQGKEFAESADRREEMERTRYETKAARDLAHGLEELFDAEGNLKPLDGPDAFRAALNKLAETHVLTKISDKQLVDLIHYSAIDKVDSERLRLDIARARVNLALKQTFDERKMELLPPGIRVETMTFESLLEIHEYSFVAGQEQSIRERDRIFNKMRRSEAMKAGVIGAISGIVAGVAVQEVVALADGSYKGVFEGAQNTHNATLLHGLFRGEGSGGLPIEIASGKAGGDLHTIMASDTAKLRLPEGFSAHETAPNSHVWEVTSTDDKTFRVELDSDGNVTDESLKALSEQGVGISQSLVGELSGETRSLAFGNDTYILPAEYDIKWIEGSGNGLEVVDASGERIAQFNIDFDGSILPEGVKELEAAGIKLDIADQVNLVETTVQGANVTPHELIWHNAEQFERVHRTLWYGNDTPGVYDLNELRTHAGGIDGNWFDAEGNVVIDISRMSPDGSFQGGEAANPFALTGENRLSLAVSVTKDTQDLVYSVDFTTTPDGRTVAVIPPDSPVHQLFQETGGEQGHGAFNGRYIEVIERTGQTDEFGEQIKVLSTYVGESDASNLTSPVTEVIEQTSHTNTLQFVQPTLHELDFGPLVPPAEVVKGADGGVVPPVPIPVRARRGLGPTRRKTRVTNPNLAPAYYGGRSLELLQDWIKAHPEHLAPRRQVIGADGKVTWLEADGTPVERSVSKERAVISRYLDKERAENPHHMAMVEAIAGAMAPMDSGCRVAVNVPAWMEGGNLKHLLEEYIGQVDKDNNPLPGELFEINILVNRKTGTPADNSVEVINGFINEFEQRTGRRPKVNYFDAELDPPYNNVGYARKLLTDAVLERSLRRADQSAPLYIESEDADLMNVDKRTVINIIDSMDANPHLDAVKGIQDRNPLYLKQNDYLFIRRRAWDFFEILTKDKKYRDPLNPKWDFTWNRNITGGWNTAYTAEAYALIGGYDNVAVGEDMTVGEKITMARGDGNVPNLEVVGRVGSRSDSSPRRFIYEIIKDTPAYDDFANEEDNKAIREKSLADALETISDLAELNDSNAEAFHSYLARLVELSRTVTPTEAESRRFTGRLMFFLGFKKDDYEYADGNLVIKNWGNLKQALQQYRVRYPAPMPAVSN